MRERAWIVIATATAVAACHGCPLASSQRADRLAAPVRAGPRGAGGDRACGMTDASRAGAAAAAAPATAARLVAPGGPYTIRAAHPRLFWTPERRARARRWIATTHFEPREDDLEGHTLVYVATGERAAGDRALALWRQLVGSGKLESQDGARWSGEAAIMGFDGLYDLIPTAERASFVEYENHVLDQGNHEHWGGVGFEDNNYYWGYLRNSLAWAIASGPENPRAKDFAEHALVTRFERSFLPFAQTVQKNGVASEGTQYGRYEERYPLVPFLTLVDGGRRIFDETDFYRGLVYYNLHATLPGPTIRGGARVWDAFPHEDDETWLQGESGNDAAIGDFMTAAAWLWPERGVGRHARWWLASRGAARSPLFAATDPGGPAGVPPSIPLDYYTPGTGYLWTRNAWGAEASVVFAQFGSANGQGHQHLDAGTFQLWRKGRWLSRETVSYGEEIAGAGGTGRVPGRDTLAHNGILIGGIGAARAYPDAPPRVTRLESRDAYAYIATDLSGAYRAHASGHQERDDNPSAKTVVRELIYLRALETVVVLDRVEGIRADTPKTALVHVEPTAQVRVDGARVTATNAGQVMRITTLVPAAPRTRVVDERLAPDDRVGQQRIEIETTGSYLLDVLQLRDAAAPDHPVTLGEDATSFTVTIGDVTIRFTKGMTAAGGTIATPGCAAHPLADYVQQMTVTDDGPVWGP